MPPNPKVMEAPRSGLWRVGRSPDPLRFSDPLNPELLENPAAGNRFDSPTGDYRVCYSPRRSTDASANALPLPARSRPPLDRRRRGFHGARGGDRRITRWIGRWAHEQRDANGRSNEVCRDPLPIPALDGVGVLGVFENVALAEQERRLIRRTTPHRRSLRFDRFLTSASQRMAQELLVVTIGICFLDDKSFGIWRDQRS